MGQQEKYQVVSFNGSLCRTRKQCGKSIGAAILCRMHGTAARKQ